MPFIRVSANVAVNERQAERVKTMLGQAIEVIPGKSEAWLMVEVEGEKALWMAGSDAPAAIAEVSVYGGADGEDYRQLTGRVCDILDSVLDIPAGEIVRKDRLRPGQMLLVDTKEHRPMFLYARAQAAVGPLCLNARAQTACSVVSTSERKREARVFNTAVARMCKTKGRARRALPFFIFCRPCSTW